MKLSVYSVHDWLCRHSGKATAIQMILVGQTLCLWMITACTRGG